MTGSRFIQVQSCSQQGRFNGTPSTDNTWQEADLYKFSLVANRARFNGTSYTVNTWQAVDLYKFSLVANRGRFNGTPYTDNTWQEADLYKFSLVANRAIFNGAPSTVNTWQGVDLYKFSLVANRAIFNGTPSTVNTWQGVDICKCSKPEYQNSCLLILSLQLITYLQDSVWCVLRRWVEFLSRTEYMALRVTLNKINRLVFVMETAMCEAGLIIVYMNLTVLCFVKVWACCY